MPKDITVFYHKPCADGAASAWAANEKFKDSGAEIKYVGMQHRSPEEFRARVMSKMKEGSDVYFLDIAPSAKLLEEILPRAQHVTIIDHHDTAIAELQDFKSEKLTKHLNIGESGAEMTWDVLHPDKTRPPFIEYAGMLDMHRREHPNYDGIAAYISAGDFTSIDSIIGFAEKVNSTPEAELAEKGKGILEHVRTATNRAVNNRGYIRKSVRPGEAPVLIPAINAQVQTYGSELSQRLIELAKQSEGGVALAWFEDHSGDGQVRLSVRTRDHDAKEVVAHLAGDNKVHAGGRDQMGGFGLPVDEWNKNFPRISQKRAEQLRSSPRYEGRA